MRLRRENTELKMDREILLKASVFFELGLVSSYGSTGDGYDNAPPGPSGPRSSASLNLCVKKVK
jgi:hypothetical protein